MSSDKKDSWHAEVGLPPIDYQKGASFTNVLTSNEIVWQMAKSLRIAQTSYSDNWKKLPPDLAPEMSAFIAGHQHVRTFLKETESLADTLTQIASLGSLGGPPVTVISSDKWIDADATTGVKRAQWNKRQQHNWLTISTNSRLVIIPGADHMSLLLVAEHADAVANAIVKMIIDIRGGRRPHITTR